MNTMRQLVSSWRVFDMPRNLDDEIQRYSKKVDAIKYRDKMALPKEQVGLNGSTGVHKADI